MMMNKLSITVSAALIGASLMTAEIASADVTANVGAANMYLFRGANLSDGAPQVFGGVDFTHETGAYVGTWVSNDTVTGQEMDLYAGFAGEMSGFTYDIGIIDYEYTDEEDHKFGELSELMISGGFGPFGLSWYQSLQGEDSTPFTGGYDYINASYTYEAFSAGLGQFLGGPDDVDYTHLDLSYAVTDELSFTASNVIDKDDGAGVNNGFKLVVTWAKEFEL
ncbi:MAG: TorF family putative porin [Pseudomonadota bacterium]